RRRVDLDVVGAGAQAALDALRRGRAGRGAVEVAVVVGEDEVEVARRAAGQVDREVVVLGDVDAIPVGVGAAGAVGAAGLAVDRPGVERRLRRGLVDGVVGLAGVVGAGRRHDDHAVVAPRHALLGRCAVDRGQHLAAVELRAVAVAGAGLAAGAHAADLDAVVGVAAALEVVAPGGPRRHLAGAPRVP